MLEFALILPLLLTLVLGCVDFGRFLYTYVAVHNGARAGCGVASFHPPTPATLPQWKSAVLAAVEDEMSDFDAAQITLADPVLIDETNSFRRVQVTVTYPFDTIVNWPAIPSHLDLGHTIEMRIIR